MGNSQARKSNKQKKIVLKGVITMREISVIEIKAKICLAQDCKIDEIKCRNCKNWAYNSGGVITSVGSSKCSRQKRKTDSYQFCRGFEKL